MLFVHRGDNAHAHQCTHHSSLLGVAIPSLIHICSIMHAHVCVRCCGIDVMLSWLETEASDNMLLDPKDRQQNDPNWILLKNSDSGRDTGVQYIANLQGALLGAQLCPALGACIPAPNTIYPNGVPSYM